MDELDRQATSLKTKSLKLTQAHKEIDDLTTKRAVMKSCVVDVHDSLVDLLDAHDTILTITVRRHLAEKLRPTLGLLYKIKGVSETDVTPKQGGEASQVPPKQTPKSPTPTTETPPVKPCVTTEPKDNEASGSTVQDKGKKIVC